MILSINGQYVYYVHLWTCRMRVTGLKQFKSSTVDCSLKVTIPTYVVCLIKDNNWSLLQFFGHKISDFRIQKIMITVHDDVGVINLKTKKILE